MDTAIKASVLTLFAASPLLGALVPATTYPDTILVAKKGTPLPYFDDVPVDSKAVEAELAALKARQAVLDARLRGLLAEREALLKREQEVIETLVKARRSPADKRDRPISQPPSK